MNFSNRGITFPASECGVTLIEIFVVITITAITLAVAIPNFSKYVKKYGVEKEITEIYGDLVEQRFKSMNSGVPNGIKFDLATQYTLFEFDDTNYDMIFDAGEDSNPVQKSGLKFDLEKKGGAIAGTVVLFDERGMAKNVGTGLTVYINSPARYNCIAVSSNRIKMGAWNSASSKCEVK
jgi:type II secretory pathway pseudopilin PulG